MLPDASNLQTHPGTYWIYMQNMEWLRNEVNQNQNTAARMPHLDFFFFEHIVVQSICCKTN